MAGRQGWKYGEGWRKIGGKWEEGRAKVGEGGGKEGGRNVAGSGSDIQIWFLYEVVKYPSKDRESL